MNTKNKNKNIIKLSKKSVQSGKYLRNPLKNTKNKLKKTKRKWKNYINFKITIKVNLKLLNFNQN